MMLIIVKIKVTQQKEENKCYENVQLSKLMEENISLGRYEGNPTYWIGVEVLTHLTLGYCHMPIRLAEQKQIALNWEFE